MKPKITHRRRALADDESAFRPGASPRPFEDAEAAYDFAQAHDLNLVWERTRAFEKRSRTLPPDQFQRRGVLTGRGVTVCGFFSKQITRAEKDADQARRDRILAERKARRGACD